MIWAAGWAQPLAFDRWYYLGLALLVIVMVAALIAAYRVWEEIHDVEEPDSPADLLASFEQARAVGDLDEQEFDRVRRCLEAAPRADDQHLHPP
jgi:hypothetical protein